MIEPNACLHACFSASTWISDGDLYGNHSFFGDRFALEGIAIVVLSEVLLLGFTPVVGVNPGHGLSNTTPRGFAVICLTAFAMHRCHTAAGPNPLQRVTHLHGSP
jgi:hypothetical protein